MNILSIGNSFSEDAQRYINKIARADEKRNILTWNLFIGGCPLSLHFRNMHSEEDAYSLGVNGSFIGIKMSIKRALLAMEWDYISVQQVSRLSFKYDSYQPYLSELVAYVRRYCPKAKILVHQTWGYLPDSETLTNMGYATHDEMFRDVAGCYDKAKNDINADALIPAGYTMQSLLKMGIPVVHRDDIHANDIGRFAIALTWYQALTGRSVKNIDFSHIDFDKEHTAEEIEIAKRASYEAVKKYGFNINSAI